MNFDIIGTNNTVERGGGGSNLSLQMEYKPPSPLAILAIPILTLDNALALKVLLPSVLLLEESSSSPTTTNNKDKNVPPLPLDKFRSLMGNLYGIAYSLGGVNY